MKNICITSTAQPWFFGPYAKQLSLVCKYLISKNYKVYYLLLDREVEKREHTYMEMVKSTTGRIDDIDDELLKHIHFIGGVEKKMGKIFISNLNDIYNYFNIDTAFFLMDLCNFVFDDYFLPKAISWFPNHFNPINNSDSYSLKYFDGILSLSPSDTKILRKKFPDKKIVHIPHIVEVPKTERKRSKKMIREKYEIPEDCFLVFINVGNYDKQNRKSLDTSLTAFKHFSEKNPKAFLLLHTYDVRLIDVNNKFTPKSGFFEIDDYMNYIDFPLDKVKMINDIVSYEEILDMTFASDVLLQGSKSEGFGVPIIEAQLLGVPVITNNFGAMGDFTYYGISVPPLCKTYETGVNGIWSIPDSKGISVALNEISKYDENMELKEKNKLYGINKIKETMNYKAVCNNIEQFLLNCNKIHKPNNLLNKRNKKKLEIFVCNNKGIFNSSTSNKIINPDQINSKWVMIVNEDMMYTKKSIERLIEQNENYELIICPFIDKNGNRIPNQLQLLQKQLDLENTHYIIRSEYMKLFIKENLLPQYFRGFMLQYTQFRIPVTVLNKPVLIQKKH